jgi:hypothetical protein
LKKGIITVLIFILLVACSKEPNSKQTPGTVDGIITHVYNNQKYKFSNEVVDNNKLGQDIGKLDNGNGPQAYEIKGTNSSQEIAIEDNGHYSKMIPIK